MTEIGSKSWFDELVAIASSTSQKLVESVLSKIFPSAPTSATTPGKGVSSGASKWIPYALIGAGLVVILLVSKGKK
jgi:hypothetical protein